MITIDGGAGNGTLWGTFLVTTSLVGAPCLDTTVSRYVNVSPAAYYLPPSDGVWYNVLESPYGPRVDTLKVGWIDSVTPGADYNPCRHSTMSGNAIYRGLNDSNCPIIGNTSDLSSTMNYQYDKVRMKYTGKRNYSYQGFFTPRDSSFNWIYDRYGALLYSKWYTNNTTYWNYSHMFSPTIVSSLIQSTLPPDGGFHRLGEWEGLDIGVTGIPASITTRNRMKFQMDSHPSRTLFQRYWEREYHDTSSYTPAESISHAPNSTGIGSVQRAEVHNEKITVTHIQSSKEGSFRVRFDYVNDMTYEGWAPWDYFSGDDSYEFTHETQLLIMSPGLTQASEIPENGLNNYCQAAPQRAAENYNFVPANEARTNAVRDVTELSSNWIENLSEVKGTMKCLTPLLEGYRAFLRKDLKAARKALASSYLVYKYVISPGIDDAKDLYENGTSVAAAASVHRFSDERRRGLARRELAVMDTTARLLYTCTYHLRLKDEFFAQIWNALEKFGIDPSSGQIWDLIPYSFVIDWFVDVGDTLRNLNAYENMQAHRDLLARIESFKVQWNISDLSLDKLSEGTLCSSGSPVEYTWYDRRIYFDMGEIDPISSNTYDGLTLSQMIQGAALVSQYR